uniref:NADH-ubiquinone oxidoreductase chain 6 n=1 Tax=Lasioderma redtenbacheri TaxID=1587376 RepID=A0A343C333_9COLE|nr:NADH dehydrogenase subunit 6 [Lasioderma redtenbacheri]
MSGFMLISFMFIMMTHPLTMVILLICMSLMISLITGFMLNTFWFSYMLFLVMVGGMLVVFIYMTSVASNEKFLIKYNLFISIFIFFIFSLFIYMFFKNYSMSTDLSLYSYQYMFNKFVMIPFCAVVMLMIIYLLITLIAVVKITQLNLGPLRQKY